MVRRRPVRAYACIAIVVLTVAGYAGVLSNGFVAGDDPGYVTENPHVLAGLSGASFLWAMGATEQSNWHPVTWLSHMLDIELFGVNAAGPHAVSLILHTANALLLFWLLAKMTAEVLPSAFVAILFAIHPLHVESVAYIAERKDVLSTFLWLLALAAWLRFLESRRVERYGVVMVCYALGLMAKPMLVTFPFTLLLLDFWPLRRLTLPPGAMRSAHAGLVKEKIPLMAMALASAAVTFVVQHRGGAVQSLNDLGFGDRLGGAAVAYAAYVRNTVWPASLSAFYPRPEAGFEWKVVAAAALVLVGVTALALRFMRRAPYVAVGWLWYLGTLVPVIGLVQVGDQAMADRYTYVPLIGVFIAVVWGAKNAAVASGRLRAVLAAAACVVVALTVRTRAEVAHWSSTVTLFSHAIDVDPDNFVAHNNLAVALYAAGHKDEALSHYARAIAIKPAYGIAEMNLGAVLAEQGRNAEAIPHYERALVLTPHSAKALNNLGLALAATGRMDEAIARWQEALRMQPDFADAHSNLGVALARSGRMTEAVAEFEAALRSNPNHGSARANLARIRASATLPGRVER